LSGIADIAIFYPQLLSRVTIGWRVWPARLALSKSRTLSLREYLRPL